MGHTSTYLDHVNGSAPRLRADANLLDLYLHHVGKSKVPMAYHKWACLSLVGAMVRDHVWFERYKDIPLTPHLYIFLIGRSGTGKDLAASRMLTFTRDLPEVKRRVYQGKTTAAALQDWLRKKKNEATDHRCWLVTMELAQDIGSGPIANDFIKFATSIFSYKPLPYREGTRTSGQHVLHHPMLNWFAGTTREWLIQSVTMDEIRGGFFARVCPVEVEIDPDENRIYKPTIPYDYERVVNIIYNRVEMLAGLEGVFDMTPEAEAIDEQWTMNRPSPADENLWPTWERQGEQVVKLAMIYALLEVVDPTERLVIDRHHIIAAQRDVAGFLKTAADLISFAQAQGSIDTKLVIKVADIIKKHGPISKKSLLRRTYKDGVSVELLHRIEQTLRVAGEIRIASNPTARTEAAGLIDPIYMWEGRRIRLPMPDLEKLEQEAKWKAEREEIEKDE